MRSNFTPITCIHEHGMGHGGRGARARESDDLLDGWHTLGIPEHWAFQNKWHLDIGHAKTLGMPKAWDIGHSGTLGIPGH